MPDNFQHHCRKIIKNHRSCPIGCKIIRRAKFVHFFLFLSEFSFKLASCVCVFFRQTVISINRLEQSGFSLFDFPFQSVSLGLLEKKKRKMDFDWSSTHQLGVLLLDWFLVRLSQWGLVEFKFLIMKSCIIVRVVARIKKN